VLAGDSIADTMGKTTEHTEYKEKRRFSSVYSVCSVCSVVLQSHQIAARLVAILGGRSETNAKSQSGKVQNPAGPLVSRLSNSTFEFVLSFDIRISDL
jgi:hypothetical protein